MIPVSALYQEAMRYSRTMTARMDIVYNDVVLENDVPLVDGSVSTDRGSNIRYQASADMGMYTWDEIPLDADGTRIRLYYGLDSLGTKEFAQVGDPNARHAGTGLGLTLTRRLIEAHGGHIELQSEPGHGAQFTVCLPHSSHDPVK